MPNYLTPGVYVEEIPAQSKPIEGVATSIAAFIGLAPGGPVNTPMRISNWTQFAKLYGDPDEPGQRPVHGGRVPRPLRLRLLPERRLDLLDRARRRRRRRRPGAWRRPRCRPPPTGASRPSARSRCPASTAPWRSRSPRRRPRAARATATPRAAATPTSRSSSPPASSKRGDRRPEPQEGPQLPADEGQRAVGAHPPGGDGREPARGAARPGRRQVQPRRPHRRGHPRRRGPASSPATSPSARAWAASRPSTRSRWSASPTCWTLGAQRRRRRPGARHPGQDDRPRRDEPAHGHPRPAAEHAAPGHPGLAQ